VNLGFAAACNQGARAAQGRLICHLNNDIVAQPGWLARMIARLEPDVGIVGARLLFPDGSLQHAGVATYPVRFGPEGIGPHHLYWKWSPATLASAQPADFDIVTGACLLTPRDLFLELGGFDEVFWNGYEDVDYCLRVRERGLRVVYEPGATLVHFESQSGVQRKRRIMHNIKTLGARWGDRFAPDHNRYWARSGLIRREIFADGHPTFENVPLPPVTAVVHGAAPADCAAFLRMLQAGHVAPNQIVWLAGGAVPADADGTGAARPLDALRGLFEDRADRYFAFVDTATTLPFDWLAALINEIEFGREVIAATVEPEEATVPLAPCAADARCTLLNLRNLPRHVRFGDVETVDGAVADLTWQAVRMGLGVRRARVGSVGLPGPRADGAFAARYGLGYDRLRRADPQRLLEACGPAPAAAAFASIVMFAREDHEYTRIAVEAIRSFTPSPYEIVIVDDGSAPRTRGMLDALRDVTVIADPGWRSYAQAYNAGIAAARGTHIVLIDNDVVVTDGWLDGLLGPLRRDPLVGITGPRTNAIDGHQLLPSSYGTFDDMYRYAAKRRSAFARTHYRTNRVAGFCLCIARSVIDAVGGLDPSYESGALEVDDLCLRARAAGYQIAVCEDVFVHHFGKTEIAPPGNHESPPRQRDWRAFAARWGLAGDGGPGRYDAPAAIARGFVAARDFVTLPAPLAAAR
jgi:GT2 family glycosyltransferase